MFPTGAIYRSALLLLERSTSVGALRRSTLLLSEHSVALRWVMGSGRGTWNVIGSVLVHIGVLHSGVLRSNALQLRCHSKHSFIEVPLSYKLCIV